MDQPKNSNTLAKLMVRFLTVCLFAGAAALSITALAVATFDGSTAVIVAAIGQIPVMMTFTIAVRLLLEDADSEKDVR